MAYWSGGRASAAITALLTAVPAPSAKHQSACLSSLPGCLFLFFFLLPLAWFPYRREGWWGDCSYRGESSFCEDSCLLFDSLFLYLVAGVPGSLFWVVGERVSEVWTGSVGWWIGWLVWLKCGVVLEGRRLLYNVSGIWNLYRLFRTLNVTRWLDMRFNRTFKSFPRVARKYIRLLYNVAINYTKCCKKAIPVIKQAAHSLKVPVKIPGIFRRN